MSGFNPLRLAEARRYRKTTIEEVALASGVSKQAVSQFENEKAEPDYSTLVAMSEFLGFPIRFFCETYGLPSKLGNTYFRALYSSSVKDLTSQKLKAQYVARIRHSLCEYIDFPVLNLPQISDIDDIENVAMQVRDYWGLDQDPILDMVGLLERNGIIVSEFSTEGKKIDAFYQYGEIDGLGYYCVILGTDKLTFARRQFNAAHELAHILMHQKYDDLCDVDKAEFRRRETEANHFAAALLLPKQAFLQDVQRYANKLNYYIELKRKWRVSISAMIMRAFDLNAINDNQYLYLNRQISKSGWRSFEPLDDYIAVKQPKAIKQAINMLILDEELSPRQILELVSKDGLTLPKDVIEEILSLEPDTLSEKNEDEGGKIIVFPQLRKLNDK